VDAEEPDFEALARAWVANDPRLSALVQQSPEKAAGLIARLAHSLAQRRESVQQSQPPVVPPSVEPLSENGSLVVNIGRDRFDPRTGLDSEALDQLSEFLNDVQEE
jgi:hypothetical protein